MTRPGTVLLLPALAAALACNAPSLRDMPAGQLYFPSGTFFARPAGAPEQTGALFVASSNFDRRYATGRLTGIDLASLACGTAPAGACVPDFPAPRTAEPIDITSLGTFDEKELSSLAGEMDGIERPDSPGTFRLLVPSRAEGSLVQVVDTAGPEITCAGEGATEDCAVGAVSLEANRLTATGVPRAPGPFAVSIYKGPEGTGDAFVTSLQQADSPANSNQDARAYTVRLNALDPSVNDDSFLNLGPIPTESVAMGRRYAFLTGFQTASLRLIDRQTSRLVNAQVELNFNLQGTRGLALTEDESEVYLLARNPDALLVLRTSGVLGDQPSLRMTHAELLPLGASQVKVVEKPGGGRVAFITCLGTQSYDAVGTSQGALVVWDREAAKVVATLPASAGEQLGFQPYGLAVQRIGNGARLYVGLFGEGRIAVVDVPDLAAPEDVRLVARLGTSHACVVNPSARGCTETTP